MCRVAVAGKFDAAARRSPESAARPPSLTGLASYADPPGVLTLPARPRLRQRMAATWLIGALVAVD